jgi:pyrroline-5-carboxylate reductase
VLEGKTIAFIGAGQMGAALIQALLRAGVDPGGIIASDADTARREYLAREMGLRTSASNAEAVHGADIVILAVKPQVLPEVLREIGPSLAAHHVVISIAAGVKTETLEAALPDGVPVVRVMPNVLCAVGEAASAICGGRSAGEKDLAAAEAVFSAAGRCVRVEERLMDAVTGLSGSGPAYVFVFIEALADGGVRAGLPRATAQQLAAQTVLGAAKMVLESGKHPAELKDMVCSPGGTTIDGVLALEQRRLRAAVMEAVSAAKRRSEELGRAAPPSDERPRK